MNRYYLLFVALVILASSTVDGKVFEYEDNNVILTNAKSIDSLIKSTSEIIVYFYTKTKDSERFMNSFLKVSSQFNDQESPVRFAVIDIEKDFNTRAKYEVQDAITIVYYKNGHAVADFVLPKTVANLKLFAENPLSPIPSMTGPGAWSGVDSQVYHLAKRNITQFIQSHPRTLVMFYSPGCGHCERMKPAYAEASVKVQEDNLGVFAAYDCYSDMSVCEKLKIKGFPTPIFFQQGKEVAQYGGDRSTEDLVEWFKNPFQSSPSQQKKKASEKEEL